MIPQAKNELKRMADMAQENLDRSIKGFLNQSDEYLNKIYHREEDINNVSHAITDYLVKPISGAKLLEAVKKVAQVIEEEKEQKEFLPTFEKEREENARLSRQKFFKKLVSGNHPVSALLKEGREIGMDLAADRYNIVLFQVFSDKEADVYSEEQNTAGQILEEAAEHIPGVFTIELGLEGWAFILKETEACSILETEQKLLEKLEQTVQNSGEEKLEYFGGVGTEVVRLSELKKCFENASRAFAYRYLKKRNQILRCEETEREVDEDENLQVDLLNLDKMDRKIVESFLKTGTRGETSHFINEYFQSLGEKNIQSLFFRQYVTMDMYFTAVSMVEQLGYTSEELVNKCGDFKAMTAVFSTVEQSREYMCKVFEAVMELRDKVSSKKYSSLLQRARDYIEENYDNEEISLNMTAAEVNLSPNHFSTIFSQETGQTFIEFLTSVRMKKAKELLRSTTMKTAEIAFAVGYKDAHYFSYLFKKTQECTPREFRAKA